MKTKWLKIEGKSVEVGTTYYRVSGVHPFTLLEQKARRENNVINHSYFLDKVQAELYQTQCQLYKKLGEQIKRTENRYAYKI